MPRSRRDGDTVAGNPTGGGNDPLAELARAHRDPMCTISTRGNAPTPRSPESGDWLVVTGPSFRLGAGSPNLRRAELAH